jgi:hypothetical protein
VEIVLKTRSKTRTGLHELQVVLTYYDGERWQTDKQILHLLGNERTLEFAEPISLRPEPFDDAG